MASRWLLVHLPSMVSSSLRTPALAAARWRQATTLPIKFSTFSAGRTGPFSSFPSSFPSPSSFPASSSSSGWRRPSGWHISLALWPQLRSFFDVSNPRTPFGFEEPGGFPHDWNSKWPFYIEEPEEDRTPGNQQKELLRLAQLSFLPSPDYPSPPLSAEELNLRWISEIASDASRQEVFQSVLDTTFQNLEEMAANTSPLSPLSPSSSPPPPAAPAKTASSRIDLSSKTDGSDSNELAQAQSKEGQEAKAGKQDDDEDDDDEDDEDEDDDEEEEEEEYEEEEDEEDYQQALAEYLKRRKEPYIATEEDFNVTLDTINLLLGELKRYATQLEATQGPADEQLARLVADSSVKIVLALKTISSWWAQLSATTKLQLLENLTSLSSFAAGREAITLSQLNWLPTLRNWIASDNTLLRLQTAKVLFHLVNDETTALLVSREVGLDTVASLRISDLELQDSLKELFRRAFENTSAPPSRRAPSADYSIDSAWQVLSRSSQ